MISDDLPKPHWYNPKVMCECGRAEKSLRAVRCRKCGEELKSQRIRAAGRPVSSEGWDVGMSNRWSKAWGSGRP